MPKRKAEALLSVGSLEEALKIAEKLRNPVSLAKATKVFPKIREFRPAAVVLASKLCPRVLDKIDTSDEEALGKIPTDQLCVLEELHCVFRRKCCRAQATGRCEKSSRILSIARPVMEKCPTPKRLSQITPIIKIMLTFTQVQLDDRAGWDEFEDWIDHEASKIPLFSEMMDPAFLFIRGQDGGPAPAGVGNALNALPVHASANDGRLSTAPIFPIRRPAVGGVAQAPIPDLYQFGDTQDAGIARSALIVWAHGTANTLDFARFRTTGAGFVWD